MTPKDELRDYIVRLLQQANEEKLQTIYYFILGIIK